MTALEFRRLALSLPESRESQHMDHPDFRVGKKIFATLGYPDAGSAMVKLSPSQQAHVLDAAPRVFSPAKGAWGARGATTVLLARASAALVKPALLEAWRNAAPNALTALHRPA